MRAWDYQPPQPDALCLAFDKPIPYKDMIGFGSWRWVISTGGPTLCSQGTKAATTYHRSVLPRFCTNHALSPAGTTQRKYKKVLVHHMSLLFVDIFG